MGVQSPSPNPDTLRDRAAEDLGMVEEEGHTAREVGRSSRRRPRGCNVRVWLRVFLSHPKRSAAAVGRVECSDVDTTILDRRPRVVTGELVRS